MRGLDQLEQESFAICTMRMDPTPDDLRRIYAAFSRANRPLGQTLTEAVAPLLPAPRLGRLKPFRGKSEETRFTRRSEGYAFQRATENRSTTAEHKVGSRICEPLRIARLIRLVRSRPRLEPGTPIHRAQTRSPASAHMIAFVSCSSGSFGARCSEAGFPEAPLVICYSFHKQSPD